VYPRCDCVTGNGKGSGVRGREIDEITERVYPKESGALRLSDHQTRAGIDGDVFAGHSQPDHREEPRGPHHWRHSHHGDVREQH